jgi:ATP-dependent 26S proteasome regulatory subunit
VVQFVRQRPALAAHGQSLRKGLLFHGAPGNGKTHTIHYLIGELKGHTTVVITAEQMGGLAQYMSLARLLQPSLVVLEDVDLIARDRMHGDSACQESLLNRLLNEMDGLAGDAEIIFLLTTNRPEALEEALAARPGRIDQAIEFGMPEEAERRKLARLYARSMDVPETVLNLIVERTEGVRGAFIKELMRRALQFHLSKGSDGSIDADDVDSALDELVMTGGRLNRRVLGFGEAGYGARFESVDQRQPSLRTRNPR